jgi:hypothetical protein
LSNIPVTLYLNREYNACNNGVASKIRWTYTGGREKGAIFVIVELLEGTFSWNKREITTLYGLSFTIPFLVLKALKMLSCFYLLNP